MNHEDTHAVTDARQDKDTGDVRSVLGLGQFGHGLTAILRRQPARRAEGRTEGGYTGAFELVCDDCGDHLYLDYSEVVPRLQRIRGPYTMKTGLAAYEQHLGLRTPTGLGQLASGTARPSMGLEVMAMPLL